MPDNQGQSNRGRKSSQMSSKPLANSLSQRERDFGEQISSSRAENKSQGKGRGWHGDPEGHARAGRMGGRASK